MLTRDDVSAILRQASLRVTKPRLAVVDAVDRLPHADTETVIDAVRAELPHVSHQAVYDSLHVLSDLGVLRRIQPAGSVARYETRVGDNHHHIVCRSCGDVADVDCAIGETLCLTPSDTHGFRLEEAEVVYWGLCPRCVDDGASPQPSGERGGHTHPGEPSHPLPAHS